MRTNQQSTVSRFADIEILEYAEYLGMDLAEDRDLFWIAKEGLKAPLPEPWKPCKNGKEEVYYFNFETGESTWEHPCDQYYKQMYQEEKVKKVVGRKPKHNLAKQFLKLPESKQAEKLKLETEVK